MSHFSDISGILWSWGPGQSRLALLAGERVVELVIDRPESLNGAVFLGRVGSVDRGLDAAFVEIGQDRPGFLSNASALGLSEGAAVVVQVRADARDGKGAKLSISPDEPPVNPALKPPCLLRIPHILERLLAAHPGIVRVEVDDAAALAEARRFFPSAQRRALPELDEIMDEALSPVVPLPSGGRLVIETAAALTAVDVDSGSSRPADANREAVAVLARHLRLRGIGGQITVDFVSGPKGTPYKLAAALKRAVASDPVPTHVFGVTPLGMVELTRERRGRSVGDILCRRSTGLTVESVALEALRRVLTEADVRPGAVLGLVVAPDVASGLARLGEAVAETGRRLGRPLVWRSEPGRDREDVMIEEVRG